MLARIRDLAGQTQLNPSGPGCQDAGLAGLELFWSLAKFPTRINLTIIVSAHTHAALTLLYGYGALREILKSLIFHSRIINIKYAMNMEILILISFKGRKLSPFAKNRSN